jgi:hypothetical protein
MSTYLGSWLRAYQMAAIANSNAAGFLINVPNAGGTSWRGVAKAAIGSEAIEGLPEYQGKPRITETGCCIR